MKILLLNCVYRQGSTGKIVASLHEGLKSKGYISFVFYGTGVNVSEYNVRKICGDLEHKINALLARISGVPFGGHFFSNIRVVNFIRQEKPDVVHVHCINGSMINVYELLTFLGKNGIKTVVTLHAEFFHTGSCSHAFECTKWINGCYRCNLYKDFLPSFFFEKSKVSWQKMKEAFSVFENKNLTITSVSPWLKNRAQQSSILGQFKNVYIPNGVDTNIFKRVLFEKHSRPCLLFVTPHFEPNNPLDQKGGNFLLEIAHLCPKYDFKIVAAKSSYNVSQIPNNVTILGCIRNQTDLCKIYCRADVTILLSKRETFSMVTAESLCCGTPVVGFKAGGPETIALEEFSIFVDYGNIEELIGAIEVMIERRCNPHQIETLASNQYSSESVTQLYVNEYKKIIYG